MTTSHKERITERAARITDLRDTYYRGVPRVAYADYDAAPRQLPHARIGL